MAGSATGDSASSWTLGMLALEVLQLPLRRKQQHAALLPVHGHARSARRATASACAGSPSHRAAVYAGGLDLDRHAVFGAKPAGDHVELQRADDADDRLAAAGA